MNEHVPIKYERNAQIYGYEWLRIRHKKDLIYKQPSHTPIVHEEHDELLRQRLSQD